MLVKFGGGTTEYGPGVTIVLTADEVATAIEAYLVAHDVHVRGPRTVRVDGALVGEVYVDPSGYVVAAGEMLSGRGPSPSADAREGGGQQQEHGQEFGP